MRINKVGNDDNDNDCIEQMTLFFVSFYYYVRFYAIVSFYMTRSCLYFTNFKSLEEYI